MHRFQDHRLEYIMHEIDKETTFVRLYEWLQKGSCM